MFSGFGTKLVGYDPGLHASDGVFERSRIQPVGLRELFEISDAVCVQLSYFSRYHGLLGERYLPYCKPHQVIVSMSHSGLFDEVVLAEGLLSGRIASTWLDSLEPGLLEQGRPLHGVPNLKVTPRLASTTRESRLRSTWAVVQRIDELLNTTPTGVSSFKSSVPMGLLEAPADEPLGGFHPPPQPSSDAQPGAQAPVQDPPEPLPAP
jgi:D-3-phosphoglycerate dehydrogenase / 2-oxoglutarate reductase